MKKKQRIGMVTIEDSCIKAFDTDGVEVKLTRHQRRVFERYKSSDFLDNVEQEFQADISKVLDIDFFIKKDGDVVYKMDA